MGIAGFERMRQRNKERGGAKSPLTSILATPEEYVCETCEKEFKTFLALKSHERVHRK